MEKKREGRRKRKRTKLPCSRKNEIKAYDERFFDGNP